MTQILIWVGSLKKKSVNLGTAQKMKLILDSLPDIQSEIVTLADFPLPLMSEDLEDQSGVPAEAEALCKKMMAAQGLIIATPEYNGSIPGPLKNAIDWLSRLDDNPFEQKPLLLTASSPGGLGGIRSLWHSRVPFEVLGAVLFGEMLGVPKAHEPDPKRDERLKPLLERYLSFVKKMSGA